MHVLITGGAGFLGSVLTRTIITRGRVADQEVSRITLVDQMAQDPSLLADPHVCHVTGDLVGLLEQNTLALHEVDVVFHLAAAVSADCERDFDLGMRSNVHATHLLLERCRSARASRDTPVRLVFASSVAVFGGELPDIVQDDTLPQPQSSYGIQKFICEQLVADYARKDFVDGRSVRLMTVSVRPGLPNGAASGFLSGIIREPIAGIRAICPVSGDTVVALSTPTASVEGLLAAADASPGTWGSRLAMNLPALTVSVNDMVAALTRVAGAAASARIDWKPDPATQRMVGGWPSRIAATRARALGLAPEQSFDDFIVAYMSSSGQGAMA